VSRLRNLFLLLVLVNLVVLAYLQWVVDRPEQRPPYQGPGITLLREADSDAVSDALLARAGEARSAVATAAPEPETLDSVEIDVTDFEDNALPDAGSPEQAAAIPDQAVASRCTSIGPYLDAEGADGATATLIASGFEPSRQVRSAQVWQGYQVYIERAENEAPGDITASLRASGIDAMPVISNTGSRDLVTIGIFPDLASAGAEAERVGELGYEAAIADSMTTAETYWLDVQLSGDDEVSLDLLQTPGRISRLEQLPCLGGRAD
jgi:hypothetical protein